MSSTYGRPSATPGPSRRPGGSELPDHEQPIFPMNQAAQQALLDLARKHKLDGLEKGLGDAIAMVTNSAGDINDRMTEKRQRMSKRASKERTTDPPGADDGEEAEGGSVDDEDLERDLEQLKEKVESMTQRMDESLRKLIDGQEGVMGLGATLGSVANDARANASTQVSTQPGRSQPRTTRQGAGLDEEEDEEEEQYPEITPTDPAASTQTHPGPSRVFTSKLGEWKTRYQNQPLSDRYGGNNHYRNFRGVVHNAQYPDEDVALAPPADWFNQGQAPKPGVTARQQDHGAESEEDDDIQISKATTSTKCPITLQGFKEPLTSKKCPHTFEASAIHEMISKSTNRINQQQGARGMVGGDKAVRCPVQSCESRLTMADLHKDLVIDRRIKRLQHARALQDQDMQDQDESQGGTGPSRETTATIEDDDEERDVSHVGDHKDV